MTSCRGAIVTSLAVKRTLLADHQLLQRCDALAHSMVEAFRGGRKVLFAGNGGSAADAQHLAAELSGRYAFDRPPLYAEALHVNSSYLTAVANDYGYDEVFARLVDGCGRPGDVFVALSTSGNSVNLLNAAIAAHEHDMLVAGFTGRTGGKLRDFTDVLVDVPSDKTPRVQECHILLGHAICGMVEETMFSRG
jgi:D-sedoheptulose 7-phosphate isomerase